MREITYRIKYRKEAFEIEVQGDKDWVESKFRELSKKTTIPEKSIEKVETLRTEDVASHPKSLEEYLEEKGNPTKHTDRIIIFGYWLFHERDMVSFNRKDILKCYSDSRIMEPKNINDLLNYVEENQYFIKREDKDGLNAWTISRSGEEYVEQMK
ncbi:MAG: hypothetical protein ACTSPB_21095 [Candidatus Thorarchaeota archaeon]